MIALVTKLFLSESNRHACSISKLVMLAGSCSGLEFINHYWMTKVRSEVPSGFLAAFSQFFRMYTVPFVCVCNKYIVWLLTC